MRDADPFRETVEETRDELDTGERITLGDTLIARIYRHNGGRIVTRNGHFDRADGLEVAGY